MVLAAAGFAPVCYQHFKKGRPYSMRIFKNDLLLRRIAIMLVVSMALISIVPQVEASFISSDESFGYKWPEL